MLNRMNSWVKSYDSFKSNLFIVGVYPIYVPNLKRKVLQGEKAFLVLIAVIYESTVPQ